MGVRGNNRHDVKLGAIRRIVNCSPEAHLTKVWHTRLRVTEAQMSLAYTPPDVSEDEIKTLVHTFYGRVREDDLIGPIFNAKVHDWPEHLAKLCDFWSSVVLRTGRFQGRPMQTHLLIADQIRGEHFDRWLDLFEKTAREVLPEAVAPVFIQRARQIADSFEFGIATQRGDIVAPRHVKRG
jgi:hemoglobin